MEQQILGSNIFKNMLLNQGWKQMVYLTDVYKSDR